MMKLADLCMQQSHCKHNLNHIHNIQLDAYLLNLLFNKCDPDSKKNSTWFDTSCRVSSGRTRNPLFIIKKKN